MELEGYSINGELGDGGMATVFKGIQQSLQRPVAIKILKNSLSNNEEIRRRFERESLIIARLNHPNIIHVIDQGITSEGLPFFVMEYIKSINLDVAIRRGGMSLNRALDVFTQIAKALAYAHKNRIIHCDIKPENILVDYEGTARVLDFGIALLYEDISKGEIDEKYVMGSDAYMAPEQHESFTLASERSDIYSLGVVMYKFLANRLPGKNIVEPRQVNPDIPPKLNTLIMSCLAESPENRPDNADELKNCLLQILKGEHLTAATQKRAKKDVKKNFVLLDVIKETEHGSVYLFEEKNSQSMIILKKKSVNTSGYAVSQKLMELYHPNIVKILGTSKNERVFILVMEYCGGGSLSDSLSRTYIPAEFYPAALQIVDALAYAYDAGLVHGNLRPTNILFSELGDIKVCDFGLNEHYKKPDDTTGNWYSVAGELPSITADIYALGVIFYQMLTGSAPERKKTMLNPNRKFNKLPKDLQQLIRKMLLLDNKKRISSYFSIRQLITCMDGSEDTMLRPVEDQVYALENKSPPKKQERNSSLAVKFLALLIVLFFGQLMYLIRHGII